MVRAPFFQSAPKHDATFRFKTRPEDARLYPSGRATCARAPIARLGEQRRGGGEEEGGGSGEYCKGGGEGRQYVGGGSDVPCRVLKTMTMSHVSVAVSSNVAC